MKMHSLHLRAVALVAGVAVLAFSGFASADPPSRVARLGYMAGAVSFSPAGESDWVQASINRPLTTGDRLWSDAGARAEIQIGGAMIRMNAATGLSVLNLDDQIAQLQLTQGTLNVRVRHLEPDQVLEVDTPNLAFTLRQPAEYRIEVDADGNATTIVVRNGQGEAYGEDVAYVIDSRQSYRFTGTGLRDYQSLEAPRVDEFDRWASDRDRSYDNSGSARYVSQDVIGYQDLDANGTWRVDAAYGNVWVPNRVAADWSPYRDGHWAWVDPWGWTWVDDAPWGFAVSHYGRWANMGGTWGWVPGPMRTQAYYAPALVAFVGGSNFQLAISGGNVGGVAWFPLGPREVYRPSYAVSRGYFENVNRSNTVINTTVINNYYTNTNVTNVVYANRQVPGAVIAMPTTAFVQSQPVSKLAVRVSRETIASAPVAVAPSVAPTEKSVRGAAAKGDVPPPRVFERPVVARAAPPAVHAGFAAQQQQLTAKPGMPLDERARKELKPVAAAPAPVVKVVAPTHATPPVVRPPATAPETKAVDARNKPEPAGKGEQRGQPATPTPPQRAAPAPVTPPQVAVPPTPVAQPPEQGGKAEQRGKGEQRARPVTPTAMQPPPQQAPQPKIAPPPQAAPPASQPPEQGGKAEQRGKGEQRAQPVTPQPTQPPKAAAPPQVVAPTAPVAQPPEQGGRPDQRGKGEQRAQPVTSPAMQPPPQQAPPPKIAPPPQAVTPPPAMQQQQAQPPRMAPPPQAAPSAPAASQPVQRARPEPAAVEKQAEPRAPVAAPKPAPPQQQPAPKAEPKGQEAKPAAGKPEDKKKDSDEQKREEEKRKQQG